MKDFNRAVYFTSAILVIETHLLSGIPGVKMFYLVALFQLFIYFTGIVKAKYFSEETNYPKLLLIPAVATFIGYMLSCNFGIFKPYSQVIVTSICTFLYPYLLYKTIDSKEELDNYLKVLLGFFIIVGIYAIIEEVTRQNIVSMAIQRYSLAGGYFGGVSEKARYGLRRCNSLLAYCSTLGMTSAFTFFILLYLRIHQKNIISKRKENILLLLLPLCVLLTGTRSQYIVFAITLFPFFFWSKAYKSTAFKLLVVTAFIGIILFSGYFEQILNSIFDSSEIGGSSEDMRQRQFDICYYYFQQRPIWGHGKDYIDYLTQIEPGLLGAESIWFRQMVNYGAIGCINYLLLCIFPMIWLFKYDFRLVFIPLAFLVGKTISIVVGIEVSYLFITCITLQKIYTYLIVNEYTEHT